MPTTNHYLYFSVQPSGKNPQLYVLFAMNDTKELRNHEKEEFRSLWQMGDKCSTYFSKRTDEEKNMLLGVGMDRNWELRIQDEPSDIVNTCFVELLKNFIKTKKADEKIDFQELYPKLEYECEVFDALQVQGHLLLKIPIDKFGDFNTWIQLMKHKADRSRGGVVFHDLRTSKV